MAQRLALASCCRVAGSAGLHQRDVHHQTASESRTDTGIWLSLLREEEVEVEGVGGGEAVTTEIPIALILQGMVHPETGVTAQEAEVRAAEASAGVAAEA